jgi:hypothetical protein
MKYKIPKIGERYRTVNFGYIQIVDYVKHNEILVVFEDGTLVFTNSKQIKEGSVKNPNKPNVHDTGYIGVGDYSKKQNHKRYKVWHSMFQRCYSKTAHDPTYKNVEVCKEWHNFQNFAKWYEDNYVEGWELDKDILVKGNKIYGPDTCCFVPKEINSFIILKKDTKNLPTGVWKHKNKYRAVCTYKNKKVHLGIFNTIQEAEESYKIQKQKFWKILIKKYENKLPKQTLEYLNNYLF